MSTAQALRYERRRRQELERQRRIRETILAILALAYMLFAFAVAGTLDYQDETRDLALWQERGVTIQRW